MPIKKTGIIPTDTLRVMYGEFFPTANYQSGDETILATLPASARLMRFSFRLSILPGKNEEQPCFMSASVGTSPEVLFGSVPDGEGYCWIKESPATEVKLFHTGDTFQYQFLKIEYWAYYLQE